MIKKSSLLVLIGIVVALLLPMGGASAQGDALLYSQNFETDQLDDWELGPGWTITEGESGQVLAGQGHVWASYIGGSWSDYRLRFRVKLSVDSTLHANFRTQAGPSRYFIGLHQNGSYISKQTGPESFYEDLAVSGGIGGNWTIVEISGMDSTITVSVNDQVVMTYTDPEPILNGGFSFESLTESQVLIDDVEIWGTAPAPAQIDEVAESGGLNWISLGGPPGGLGYDIRYKFDDPNIWYVTDVNAGVHISYDNGLTWQRSNQGIETIGGPSGDSVPIFSLTVDPHNPQIIWTGTDKTGDIYKSTDGGRTWKKKANGIIHEHEIWLSFRGFTVDPNNSDIVYAMGELQEPDNNVWGLKVGGVIYKTSDGGEHWTRIWHGAIPSSLARYMWINPENTDILYVSTGIFDRGAVGETDPETNPDPFGGLGVLKSTDGGQTWRVLGKENGLDFLYIGSLYMHPENPDVLFAAAGHVITDLSYEKFLKDNHSPLGIYRTTDGGESWQQILESEQELFYQTFTSVEICPSDFNIIYAGTEFAIYRSQDGGDSWTKTTPGVGWGSPDAGAGWPIDMQCDPRNPDRVFANNYSGGNFLSEDGGKTWINASAGYSGAQIISIAVDPFDSARVFVAGRSGPWYSTDGGVTWRGIKTPERAGGGGVAIDPIHQDHIIMGGEVFIEWVAAENRWVSHRNPANYYTETAVIEFAPSDSTIVYAGSANHNTIIHSGVYEEGNGAAISRDGGSNWTNITGQEFNDVPITDLSIDPTDPNSVYVATQVGLFKSQDAGESWESLSNLSNGKPVRTICVYPGNPNKLFAGIPFQGLYTSEDGGNSWRQIVAGLEPNGEHRDIIFDPSNSDIMYVADITSGVYRSTDVGESWKKITDGLSNRGVTGLAVSSDGNHLYAATSGGGVFRLDLNNQPPEQTSAPLITTSRIQIDGLMGDWADQKVLESDPVGDGEADYLDLTAGYAYLTEEALYFVIDTDNPEMPLANFDIQLQADDRLLQISWAPGNSTGLIGDITSGWKELGETQKSEFAFGPALEARIDLRDLGSPIEINLRDVNIMVGECCEYPAWRAADTWHTDKDTPTLDDSIQEPTPESIQEQSSRESPDQDPTDAGSRGFPCPNGLAPIALFGFIWVSRRRRLCDPSHQA